MTPKKALMTYLVVASGICAYWFLVSLCQEWLGMGGSSQYVFAYGLFFSLAVLTWLVTTWRIGRNQTTDFEVTPRGFCIYGKFEDSYGNVVRVQQSSNVEGGIWIFCDSGGRPSDNPNPHLSPENARQLIQVLEQAIRDQEERYN